MVLAADDHGDVLDAVHRVGDRRRADRSVHERRLPQLLARRRGDRREVAVAVLRKTLAEVSDEGQAGRGIDGPAIAGREPGLVPLVLSADAGHRRQVERREVSEVVQVLRVDLRVDHGGDAEADAAGRGDDLRRRGDLLKANDRFVTPQ